MKVATTPEEQQRWMDQWREAAIYLEEERDWPDVEAILARQGPRLDLDLVFTELPPLADLKEAPEILDRLQRLIARRDRPFTRIPPPPGSP